jgi:hypothetical protein
MIWPEKSILIGLFTALIASVREKAGPKAVRGEEGQNKAGGDEKTYWRVL